MTKFINENPNNLDSLSTIDKQKGILLDSLNISLNKWYLRLHWQKTKAQKAGFWHKLKKHQETLDLDLSCLLFNDKQEILERVWFKNVRDKAEAVRYQGDELIGDRILKDHEEKIEPKYESMSIALPQVSAEIYQLVLVLSSYTGHDLNLVKQGNCSLIDDEGNDIFNINLTKINENTSALWLTTLTRHHNQWYFKEEMQPLNHYKQLDFEIEISTQLKNLSQ